MKNEQRKMKNSGIEWIGEIPNDWNVIYGQYLYDIVTGKKDVNQGDLDGKYPFFTCSDDVKRINEYSFDCEALLVAGNGIVGNTKYYNGKFDAYQRTYVLHDFKKKKIDIEFLKIYLSNLLTLSVEAKTTGSVIEFIKLGDVKKFEIVFPEISKQNEIAELLNKRIECINKLIEIEEQQIEKLKEYKQSLITEVVTKGLDKNVEMKDSGVEWIGKIPKDWQVIKLKFLLRGALQYGANETGHNYSEVNKFRYIRITDIDEEGALKEDIEKQFLSAEESKDFLLSGGDVLFARSGATVGKSFIYYDKYGESAFAGYLIRAKCDKNKLLPEFLNLYTKSSIYELWKNSIFIQATIQNIGAQKYSNLFIPIMSIDEQNGIINYLNKRNDQIDKIVDLKKKKIEKLNKYKKSLIYEYVTGKKEV